MQTWINGAVATALPLPDRGFDYGDGLFETMPVIAGRIPWLHYHLERLCHGLLRLGFPKTTSSRARESVRTALDDWNGSGVMRLTVTRGAGPRGYAPPDMPQPRCIVQAWDTDNVGQPALPPASIRRCSIALPSQPALAGIKHLNRLEQVLAAREREETGMDELLMTDPLDNAISVISGNLFLVRGRVLLTPTLAHCGVSGTRRRLLLEDLGPALGFDCREATIGEPEVEAADEVLYCNSLRGYQAIGRYGSREWSEHPALGRLQTLYRERLQTCGG